jgi:hypothetical protein
MRPANNGDGKDIEKETLRKDDFRFSPDGEGDFPEKLSLL